MPYLGKSIHTKLEDSVLTRLLLQGLTSKIMTVLEMHRMQVLLAQGSRSPSLCLFANCAGGTGRWGGLHNLQDMGRRTTVK